MSGKDDAGKDPLPPAAAPTPPRTVARLPPLTRVRSARAAESQRSLVLVCHGASCSERGGPELLERLRTLPGAGRLLLCSTTCLDHCATGPNVVLADESRIHTGMLPSRVDELGRMLLPDGD